MTENQVSNNAEQQQFLRDAFNQVIGKKDEYVQFAFFALRKNGGTDFVAPCSAEFMALAASSMTIGACIKSGMLKESKPGAG